MLFLNTNIKLIALTTAAFLLASCSNSSEGLGVYPKAVGRSDEGFAVQSLRTIATAEAQMNLTQGSYGDFKSLVQAGFLDTRFDADSPNLKGYRFSIKASASEFTVNADPNIIEGQPTTGVRHFYMDSSDNVIHVNLTAIATKADPAL